jgi:hypothetical protein
VWDLATGMLLRVIPADRHPLADVGISPDGALAATIDDQSSVNIWRINPDGFALTAPAQTIIDYAQLLTPTDLPDAEVETMGTGAADRNSFSSWVRLLGNTAATESSCDSGAAASRATSGSDDGSAAAEAVATCEQAIVQRPNEPRLRYLLGRALEAAGRQEDAAASYRKGAEAGYAIAAYRLGQMYMAGDGHLEKSQADAAIWFGRAAAGGYADAAAELALMNFRQAQSPQDRDSAMKRVVAAAERGSAAAYAFLAKQDLAESEPKLSDALYHMILAYRLSPAAGGNGVKRELETGIAAVTRRLAAPDAVAIASKARAWSVPAVSRQ